MDEYIKEIGKTINFDNNLIKVNNNLYLTKKEIDILTKYFIPYQTCHNYHILLYLIDEYLNNEYIEELEQISLDISERSYYQNTNK